MAADFAGTETTNNAATGGDTVPTIYNDEEDGTYLPEPLQRASGLAHQWRSLELLATELGLRIFPDRPSTGSAPTVRWNDSSETFLRLGGDLGVRLLYARVSRFDQDDAERIAAALTERRNLIIARVGDVALLSLSWIVDGVLHEWVCRDDEIASWDDETEEHNEGERARRRAATANAVPRWAAKLAADSDFRRANNQHDQREAVIRLFGADMDAAFARSAILDKSKQLVAAEIRPAVAKMRAAKRTMTQAEAAARVEVAQFFVKLIWADTYPIT